MNTNTLNQTTLKRLVIIGARGTHSSFGLFDLFSNFLQEVSYLAVLVPFGIIFGAIVAMLVPSSYVSTPLSAIAIVCWPLELLAVIFAGAFVIRVLRFYPVKWLCSLIARLTFPMELGYHK
jgi:hypothetical protein